MTKDEVIAVFDKLSEEDKAAIFNTIAGKAIDEVKSEGLAAWVKAHWKAIAAGIVTIGTAIAGAFSMTSCTVSSDQAALLKELQHYVIRIEPNDCK